MATTELSAAAANTLRTYYERVAKGDFPGVANCLSPDVVYSIPGQSELLPFAGVWTGRERVLELFGRFGQAFWITHLNQTCTIQGENEVFEFNDEAFKVKTTGRYYRVGVVHRIRFTEDGLIQSLYNTHDTYVASQAFSGGVPIAEPLPPPSSGEGTTIDSGRVTEVVKGFFNSKPSEAVKCCAPDVAVLVPGDPSILRFSGYWLEHTGVTQFFDALSSVLDRSESSLEKVLANGATVAAVGSVKGQLRGRDASVAVPWVCLVQMDSQVRIQRITYYIDTDPMVRLLQS